MSNELIVKAADAVDTLRNALELWCTRDESAGSPLGVRGAADDATAAAAAAITELAAIRNQVEREALAYDQAGRARTDALLGEILIAPLHQSYAQFASDPALNRPERTGDYECGDCGRVFPVDPMDPIESHGAYLDHIAEHDDDAEAEL